jgi:aspartate carbamoyltransferase regulatory subunit
VTPTNQLLLIPKIESGVVIDHIPGGLGPRIVEIIHAHTGLEEAMVSLGLNYGSTKQGRKDMVKLHEHPLPASVLEQISLVAPGVTIKRVEGFEVVERIVVQPPRDIVGFAVCGNPNCVTNTEPGVATRFLAMDPKAHKFRCAFCERVFRLRDMNFVRPRTAWGQGCR